VAELPTSVRSLVSDHIRSVEELEVLLLLHATRQDWTADAVHDELKTSRRSIARRLEQLEAAGLVVRAGDGTDTRFRYGPADAASAAAVDQLAHLYRRWRVAIIDSIYRPSQREASDRPSVRPPTPDPTAPRMTGADRPRRTRRRRG
jgi:predicted transcriptional regulator